MLPDILLISNNPELCSEITDILHEYDVESCTESESLFICTHQPVRVVLIVQDKPGAGGLDLFANLRESRPGLLGFLIADRAVAADLCLAAMDYGFSGMFFPPLAPDHVREKVSRAMGAAARYREYGERIQRTVSFSFYEHFAGLTRKQDVLERLRSIIIDQVAPDILSIMLYDKEQGVLRIAASQGLSEEIVDKVRTKPGEKIAGRVFQEHMPVILNQETQNKSGFAHLLNRPEIVSAISLPIIVRDEILGVLNISYTDGDIRIADSDIEILSILATGTALALEQIDAFEFRLQEALLKERDKERRGTNI